MPQIGINNPNQYIFSGFSHSKLILQSFWISLQKLAHENAVWQWQSNSLFLSPLIPLLERKTFTPSHACECCFQLSSQVHEHSLRLLFFVSLRICASGWRGWTLLRASRSAFWRSLDPSVWWKLHTPHCPGHLCRAGMWQGCVCPGTCAIQRVRWPGLGWRVQVWGGGAWALVLPQSALSRGHVSPQWSCSGCLFRWDAHQDLTSVYTQFKVKKKSDCAEILSFSISVHRSPAHEKWHLSVWGAGGDEYFWTLESSLCLPLESGQCQCCLSSARLWSRHLHPKWNRRKWSTLESPISLLRGWVFPVEMPCDYPGCSWLFPWQHGLCDLLR